MNLPLCELCCLAIVLVIVCSFAINMHINRKCGDKQNQFNNVEFGLFIAGVTIPTIILFLLIIGLCFGSTEEIIATTGLSGLCRIICLSLVVGGISSLAVNMHNNKKNDCDKNKSVDVNNTSNTEFIIFIVGLILSVIALIYVIYKMINHPKYRHYLRKRD